MKERHLSIVLLLSILAIIGYSCSSDVPLPKSVGALPTEHQLKWQELEFYMFIHFGPNTFTNVEWGDGKEDPKVFNPTELNTDQWASIAKDAGMKGIIITAKHHDGFCLWPSEFSTHTVRESPWKDGKGDVLKELSESCKKYGLQMGVYLSPWDQNHPAYNTSEYNQVFANTLNEVLSNYGHIFEQWFDGATDGTSRQIYDWDLFHKTVYDKQPHAIIFSDVGPGCRWIGNERGYAGETNWSTLNVEGFTPGKGAPATDVLNKGDINGEKWVAGEVDVSIRPGWFYSPATDDKVKSVEHLMDIYYSSVGRNANLLLNVPPDRRGLIHPNDSARLMEFKAAREKAFNTNLADGATATASNVRGNAKKYSTENLFDNNNSTYWTTDDGISTATITIELKETTSFNNILLQEYIALGQRIEEFKINYWDTELNEWVDLGKGTTVGYKRILRTPRVSSSKIQIEIRKSLAEPILSSIEIYDAPDIPSFDVSKFSKQSLDKKDAIILDLKETKDIKGFVFTPFPSERETTIQRYNCYISKDGKQWEKVQENAIFNNVKNNPIPQQVIFDKVYNSSYIKLEPTLLTNDNSDKYTYAELKAIE